MTAKHPSWGEQPFDVADAGEQKSKVKKSKLKSKLKLKLKVGTYWFVCLFVF